MIAIFKSKTFIYGLLIVAVVLGFYQWQGRRELTNQLEEKSKQLKTIMDNPIIREVEGPVRIVQGKTIVKTVVVEKKVDGTEVTTETEIITEPTIVEKAGSSREVDYKDPLAEAKKKRYALLGSYTINGNVGLGLAVDFLFVQAGPIFEYNYKEHDFTTGVFVLVRF